MSTQFVNTEIKYNDRNKIILTNLVKMLTNRNNILKEENLKNNTKLMHDQIDDNLIFKIKSDYDNDEYCIKFYFQKMTTIKKVAPIEDFLKKYKNHKMIIVIKSINQKVYKQFIEYPNIEIFFDHELMINLMEFNLIPKHIVLNKEEKEEYVNAYQQTKSDKGIIKGMSRINVTDPVSRYYNMKPGDIVKIIRPSTTSGYSIFYRKVVVGVNLMFAGPNK
jgi:DNA-directed RNA polymerases I, II, and III subunit RPABC1